jgi:hypothetical protein
MNNIVKIIDKYLDESYMLKKVSLHKRAEQLEKKLQDLKNKGIKKGPEWEKINDELERIESSSDY